jgi:hypothetical protein
VSAPGANREHGKVPKERDDLVGMLWRQDLAELGVVDLRELPEQPAVAPVVRKYIGGHVGFLNNSFLALRPSHPARVFASPARAGPSNHADHEEPLLSSCGGVGDDRRSAFVTKQKPRYADALALACFTANAGASHQIRPLLRRLQSWQSNCRFLAVSEPP